VARQELCCDFVESVICVTLEVISRAIAAILRIVRETPRLQRKTSHEVLPARPGRSCITGRQKLPTMLAGGLLPAIRAARLSVVRALRAT
jgi:hypothetical protein